MSELSSAVCSITATRRRRYFWAVWWTETPGYGPFVKPDQSDGGAHTREAAFAAAEAAAGRRLQPIEAHWARAWKRVLRGQPAGSKPQANSRKSDPVGRPTERSAWAVLDVPRGASLAEVKQGFRLKALQTHPDQGGDSADFVAVREAYNKLVRRLEKTKRRPLHKQPPGA